MDGDRSGSPVVAFLVELLSQEESLFHVLLVERVAVPTFLLLWMIAAGASTTAEVAMGAFIAWELATSVAMWPRLGILKRHPLPILSLEQAVCLGLFLSVGVWRGTLYYTLAAPIVFAAACVSTGYALFFAAWCSAVAIVAIGVFHLPDGRGPRDQTTVQDWGGAAPLFVAAAFLVSLVRHLLDRLDDLGRRAEEAKAELDITRQNAAVENARWSLTSEVHEDLRQRVTLLPAYLRALASRPAEAASAGALRHAAAVVEKGGADLKTILAALRPRTPGRRQPPEDMQGDAALAELSKQRLDYFKGITAARLFFVGVFGVFLIDAVGPRFWAVFGLWLATLVWVLVTSAYWREAFRRLTARPQLLRIEEAIAVALLLFGTTRNGNGFWIMGATAAVLATAVGSMWQAAGYTALSVLAAFASIFVAKAMGWQAPPSQSGTVAATFGYIGPVLPAIYVAFLFRRMNTAALTLREREQEAEELRHELARKEARQVAVPLVLDALRPVVDEVRTELATIDSDSNEITVARARVVELDQNLNRLAAQSHRELFTGDSARLAEIIGVAVGRVRTLGAEVAGPVLMPSVVLPADRANALAGLLSEALFNAFNHGDPPIELDARQTNSLLQITLSDRGSGFDVTAVEKNHGLWILRRYQALAEASVAVSSDPRGTQISVELHV
jgi:signal transduction histidine kinase